ncbi:acetyl- synthase subunit delta, putative [Babesia ovata]|uniref:Acetyl-synthase subunit delta, putative n=1 Tax=Babesia ovata TaxID=189622 RepID=A0A2H6KKB5_9APIC|nr:acetyl- synthase subunit delta, putative [Babesia ovata]GBE63436.1 acetyl- synthase subunit delta, putative [Babesia ovata]
MKERHHPVAQPVKVAVHDALAGVITIIVAEKFFEACAEAHFKGDLGNLGKAILGQGGSDGVREWADRVREKKAKEGDEGGRWVERGDLGVNGIFLKLRFWVRDADGGGDGGGSEATSEGGGEWVGE